MADRVDAAVERVKAPRPQPALDRAACYTGLQELVSGEDPVLAGGEAGKGAFALSQPLPALLSQT
ncbi:MAG TPA: hypothetical protein VEQ41_02525 [Solirubrobacterales bacterium]|nr:hypothetical protein [Solirubrobacterales bacterium]